MRNKQLEISSHIIMPPPEPKVIVASPSNFTRIIDSTELQYNERPMMLTVWTQTTTDDFNYISEDHIRREQQQCQTEQELREKIRVLEESLRTQSQLLSQIHATSAICNSMQMENQQQQQHPQHFRAQLQQQLQQQNQPSALINAVQQVSQEACIKYRIVTESNSVTHGDPIEIQLAENENAANLNCSADSGRLEICLPTDVDQVEVKRDLNKTSNALPPREESAQSLQDTNSQELLIKRRKICAQSSKDRFDEHNGTFNSSYTNFVDEQIVPNGIGSSDNSSAKTSGKSPIRNDTRSNLLTPKIDMDNVMVSIGPNNTRIPAKVYESISWTTHSIATRKLLMAIFDRKTLATHSMTGKPSPAFKGHGKPLKKMLDPLITQDIIFAVSRRCNVSEKEVRNAITTKCADENKMLKLKQQKGGPLSETNKENVKFEYKLTLNQT